VYYREGVCFYDNKSEDLPLKQFIPPASRKAVDKTFYT